jgi:hypothetical protein
MHSAIAEQYQNITQGAEASDASSASDTSDDETTERLDEPFRTFTRILYSLKDDEITIINELRVVKDDFYWNLDLFPQIHEFLPSRVRPLYENILPYIRDFSATGLSEILNPTTPPFGLYSLDKIIDLIKELPRDDERQTNFTMLKDKFIFMVAEGVLEDEDAEDMARKIWNLRSDI